MRGLAEELRAASFEVTTRSRDIELVEQIDHALSFLFRLIAAVGVTGCPLALHDGLLAALLTEILAVAASMLGAIAVARVDPADGLREG